MNVKRKLLLGAVFVAGLSPQAVAQVEEIVIEATRREESIQEVPISATAYGKEDIEALRLQSAKDIGNQAPNINLVQGNFGFGAPVISVRGITNGDFSAISNTPVAVYSDDIVLTNVVAHGFSLYDLERIELLRGPQGTLFGRNSTSGALQFISAKPTDEFAYGGHVSIARHDDLTTEAYISGPLTDRVKGRLAFYRRTREGVVENTALDRDEGEIENWSIRGILEADVNDKLDVILKVQHSEADGDGNIFHNSLGDNPFLTPAPIGEVEPGGEPGRFNQIVMDLPSRKEKVKSTEYSLRGDYDLNDNWTLTGIFGYVDIDFNEFNDDDATRLRVVHEFADRQVEQKTAEFRLAGEVGSVDLVTGLFFMDENTKALGNFEITDDPGVGTAAQIFNGATLDPNARLVSSTESEQDLKSFAAFAHGKFPITERLSGSIGLRYSRDEKDLTVYDANVSSFISNDPFFYGQRIQGNSAFTNFLDPFGFFPAAGTVNGKADSEAVTGEVSVEYFPTDDVMLYTTYRRGFKGSTFDPTQTNTPLNFVPVVPKETIDAFEVGAKTAWFDDRLIVNTALFKYDYKDFQAFEFLSVGGFLSNLLISLPEVEVKGIEIEVAANPIEGLHFNLGAGFLDTEIVDASAPLPPGVTLTIAQGNEIRNAPEKNFNGSVYYEYPILDGDFFLVPQLDWYYVGEYYSDFINSEPGTTYSSLFGQTAVAENGSLAGDYHQLNARIALLQSDGRWGLTFFGENITNELQVTGRFPGNIPNSGTDFATVNDGSGRVFGLRLDIDM